MAGNTKLMVWGILTCQNPQIILVRDTLHCSNQSVSSLQRAMDSVNCCSPCSHSKSLKFQHPDLYRSTTFFQAWENRLVDQPLGDHQQEWSRLGCIRTPPSHLVHPYFQPQNGGLGSYLMLRVLCTTDTIQCH